MPLIVSRVLSVLSISNKFLPVRNNDPSSDFSQPDLLVTVNFTTLGISSDHQDFTSIDSVQVYYALTDDIHDTVMKTPPTTLVSGVNLIGMVKLGIRHEFVNLHKSSSGLYSVRSVISLGCDWG